MKLLFTEKFLWDIYNLIEGISDVYTAFSLPSLKDALYPDIAQLRKIYKKKKNRREFAKFISYLKNRGYLKIREMKNRTAIILTPKGWQKALKFKIKKKIEIKKVKRRRDKKWVMVFFDIPERRKNERDWLRWCLRNLGFQKLQESIWVSPYDVLNDAEILIKNLKLGGCVKLLLVEEVES
jgi:hypothetical protein